MTDFTYKSPPLTEFPKRVVIITDKNFAGVCSKLQQAFSTIPGMDDCRYIHARSHGCEEAARNAFSGLDHSRILCLYYDPGDVQGCINKFTDRINSPRDIPWGLIRGSSFYRVTNLQNISTPGRTNVKKNGKFRKIVGKQGKGPVKKALTVNHGRMREMNEHFDSLTPLIMCGTEDLLGVNWHNCYLGQPQEFLAYIPDKTPALVGHVTTPARGNDYKKGTGLIRNVFTRVGQDFPEVETRIIGNPSVTHARCLKFLEQIGISVLTMTSWDYGMGYVGLESLSRSCLCVSRPSKFSHHIRSRVQPASTADELWKTIKFYNNNPEQFEQVRQEQYLWALKHFTPRAIGKRFQYILNTIINDGWRHAVRPGLRELREPGNVLQ